MVSTNDRCVKIEYATELILRNSFPLKNWEPWLAMVSAKFDIEDATQPRVGTH